jgi:purine-binding chemotaxis protein CheW
MMVVLSLAGRELALHGDDVVEVLRMVAITPIPEAKPWLMGVMNIRGHIAPVIDLRTRLGLPSKEPGLDTPIVVVEVGERRIALTADAIVGIEMLASDALEAPDRLAGPLHAVSTVGHVGSRVILVLDIERICSGVESLSLTDADDGRSS